MNTIVIYYSGKGSNDYLAKKVAGMLGCEAVEIKPRVKGLVLPATATKISFGNKPIKQDFGGLNRLVLCGPLYMGSIAAPCNDFIRKYEKQIKKFDFITCCGSTDEKKDDTFGYGLVFGKLKERLGSSAGEFEAFPIAMLLPEELKDDDQANMNTRMNDDNYNEAVKARIEDFVKKLNFTK
jgi:hypothetical protein